jgi:Xaa-Pro aminopeptidase
VIPRQEFDDRHRRVRELICRLGTDALLVCGNQYTGFDGAVRYLTDFQIVHRYAYVLVSAEDVTLVLPAEARWIGDKTAIHADTLQWPTSPGEWLAKHFADRGWRRVATYGTDRIMPVADYRHLAAGPCDLVEADDTFDRLRAAKTPAELEAIRRAMRILERGFALVLAEARPGRSEAEILAPAVALFTEAGASGHLMNIVLAGTDGRAGAHFRLPSARTVERDDLLIFSLEVTGPEGYWGEFSRPVAIGRLDPRVEALLPAYASACDDAARAMTPGRLGSDVHHALAGHLPPDLFGHLSGHGIGTTMLEAPWIGQASRDTLEDRMVFALHPHVVVDDPGCALYLQETYVVSEAGGGALSRLPLRLFRPGESDAVASRLEEV